MNADAAGAIAFGLAAGGATILLLRRFAPRLPRDAPNARSLHETPVPRAGGYAVWVAFVPAAIVAPPPFVPPGLSGWLPAWLAVVAVSAVDDIRGVPAAARLAVHVAAALACAYAIDSGGGLGALGVVAGAVAIAWMANLYNFMDGSDGLAGSTACIGFGAYAIAAAHGGADATALWALVGGALAFLAVNRPRATMFLGDAGAVPLGFLAGAFGLAGIVAGLWPAWFPPLVFLPFVADATATLLRRAARGERVGEAHRDHFYQRLNRMGAGHAGTLAAYTAATAACAALALACTMTAPTSGWAALGSASVVCFVLFGAIDARWRRHPGTPR